MRIRHKWNKKHFKSSPESGISYCVNCGYKREFVKGYATYFIDDKVYSNAPKCTPNNHIIAQLDKK